MALQNHNMNLVLSTDAKPRLKWTQELHQRFVDAVDQLGGADKATPKGLMRVIEIPGLTLYHLKSHLQKYRLGKSQQSLTSIQNMQEDDREVQSSDRQEVMQSSEEISRNNENHNPIDKSFQIAQALQLQMEVQRKLHEQIEVQRHLQLRIEAQGKYLQSVLKKAQETLAGYDSSSMGIQLAKAELSRLVSMVNAGCPSSSSISELTEPGGGSSLKYIDRTQRRSAVSSMESSLTSSESCGRKEVDLQQKTDQFGDTNTALSVELPLLDIHPKDITILNSGSSNQGKKRSSGGIISDGVSVEQPMAKRLRSSEQLRLGTFDLNS